MSNDTVNEYCKQFKSGQHLGNATGTSWSDVVRGSWKGPRSTVILIEVLASLAAVAFMFLATFGSHHRHRGNKFIQKVLLGAYTLSVSLLTYILGSMQSSSVKSSMYPFWAISLVAMYGCTDSITGYVLDTNRQVVEFLYQIVLCYAYMLVILITTWLSDGFHVATLPALFLCVTAVQKYWLRRLACRLASCSSNVDVMVADYMKYDEHMRGTGLDADGMEGCYYLVEWPLSKSRIDAQTCAIQLTSDPYEPIDVGKVWHSVTLGPTLELKEACLSFSLFHLLRRRFFGFACGESKDKSHDFVFRVLLSEDRARDDCNWVFKVIEVELAFMYDFFFTKYASLYYGLRAATYWSLASTICISLTTYAAATRALTIRCDQAESFVMNTKTDAVVTLLLLTCAALVELLQPVLYWTTIWGRVSFVCQYIRKISKERVSSRKISCLSCPVMMRLKWCLLKIGMRCMSNKHYWQHKLGQYSFLDSVNYDTDPKPFSQWKKIMSSLKIMLGTPDRLIGQSIHRLKVTRKPDKPVELPAEVKKALVGSLLRTWGVLSNGKSSLQSNGAHHLLWACEMDVRSKTISIMLTWHIATCYVEMAATASPCQDVEMCSRDVATKLSKYCAYLLIFAPKFLPGQETDSKLLFDATAGEAIKFFRGRRDKYEAMREREIRLYRQIHSSREVSGWGSNWRRCRRACVGTCWLISGLRCYYMLHHQIMSRRTLSSLRRAASSSPTYGRCSLMQGSLKGRRTIYLDACNTASPCWSLEQFALSCTLLLFSSVYCGSSVWPHKWHVLFVLSI